MRPALPLLLLALASLPAQAADAGDWQFSVGAHVVAPTSGNGSLAGGALAVDVDDSVRPTVTAEYFLAPRLGVELLAAWPFEHDIELDGVHAATVQQLPPTLSLQYHFGEGRVSPFLGAGINFTTFFDEETRGPIDGTDLSLDNSWGLAAHAGIDIAVGDGGNRWVRLDARWIDIDTDVSVDGADLGSVRIDPLVYGAAFVWAF